MKQYVTHVWEVQASTFICSSGSSHNKRTWHYSWSLQVLSALQLREYNWEWKLINAVRIKSILYYYMCSATLRNWRTFIEFSWGLIFCRWALKIDSCKFPSLTKITFRCELIKCAWNYYLIKRKMWKIFWLMSIENVEIN